ncbi:MAG: TetR/AcrR family transcriptional regulator, partial [Candidatus Nanopelagicales bacterium]
MSRATMHPTKAILVETVVEMFETIKPADIQADKVLEISGISKGSLYHHFEDLGELVETAQVARYSKWITVSVDTMTNILPKAKNISELRVSLAEVTKATQRHDLSKYRLERARTLANAEGNPRFQKALAEETDRLTSLLEDLCREVIEKGWFRKDLNPRALAVFIQSYTLGKLVDDFSPNR